MGKSWFSDENGIFWWKWDQIFFFRSAKKHFGFVGVGVGVGGGGKVEVGR